MVNKDIKNNRLIVGDEDDSSLFKKKIQLSDINWLTGQPPKFPLKCEVRLRHRQPLQNATVKRSGAKFIVDFGEPQRAVTPGQFAVFYKDSECLGGGAIV